MKSDGLVEGLELEVAAIRAELATLRASAVDDEVIDTICDLTARATRTERRLHALSRAGVFALSVCRETDPLALVEHAANEAADRARRQGLRIVIGRGTVDPLWLDAEQLTELVRVIVDGALAHGADEVRLGVGRERGDLALEASIESEGAVIELGPSWQDMVDRISASVGGVVDRSSPLRVIVPGGPAAGRLGARHYVFPAPIAP